jgi:hypothetical protein
LAARRERERERERKRERKREGKPKQHRLPVMAAGAPTVGALGWAQWEEVRQGDDGLHLARVEAVRADTFDCEWIGTAGQRSTFLPNSSWASAAPSGSRPAYVGMPTAASCPPKLKSAAGPVPSGEPRVWVGADGIGVEVGDHVGPGCSEGAEVVGTLAQAVTLFKSWNQDRGIKITSRGSSGNVKDNARLKCTHGMGYGPSKSLVDLPPGGAVGPKLVEQAASIKQGSPGWHAVRLGRTTGNTAQRVREKGVSVSALFTRHLGKDVATDALATGGDLVQAVDDMMARGLGVTGAMASL